MRTISTFLTLSFHVILVISGAECVRAQAVPTLLTEENSTRAIAFDSVTYLRDPLPVVDLYNFQLGRRDPRTRVSLFALNADLNPGENASAVTVTARDSRSRSYSLKVEFVGKVPQLTWLTQVVAKLPDELSNAGDVSITMSLHGQTSNEVLLKVAVQTEPRQITLPARRVINGQDNYVDACFSFEFGRNGAAAVAVTHNDWDILFGNSFTRDIFDVTMVTDDCSRIRDLGPLNWSDSFQVPAIPAYPVPTDEPSVDAIVGHMYVVHTKDTGTDMYALFRVEALDPLKSVTISWKSIQRPLGD